MTVHSLTGERGGGDAASSLGLQRLGWEMPDSSAATATCGRWQNGERMVGTVKTAVTTRSYRTRTAAAFRPGTTALFGQRNEASNNVPFIRAHNDRKHRPQKPVRAWHAAIESMTGGLHTVNKKWI
jgi:hypothetical protein